MKSATILTGSNSGNKSDYLKKAITAIEEQIGEIFRSSSIYESEAWGYEDPENYLNQIILINTLLTPDQLLGSLQNIEYKLGRIRPEGSGYSCRTIDLDILFYDNMIIDTPALSVPHPRLHLRKFTLLPLAEIMPDYIHPVLNKTMKDLLKQCSDEGIVRKLS